MKKQLLSIIMTLVLCLSFFPATALAEEAPTYLINENNTLVISGTTDGSDLPTTGFTSIEIASTGVVTGGAYLVDVDNYGTITGGSFAEVLNRNGGTGSSLALITGGTFEKVSNYGNMTGGTVGTLNNFDTTNYGHTVQGVTVTEALYNNNSVCYDMILLIGLDSVHNGFGSITYVRMTVDGAPESCPVGQKANSWLKTNVENNTTWYKVEDGVKTPLTDTDVFPCGKTEYVSDRVTMVVNGTERLCPVGYQAKAWLRNLESNDWYRLDGEEWVKLTDADVFPDTRTVYSTIPGKSLGTMGSMSDINGNWIARVGDTLGVFNNSAQWYVGGQPVAGKNEGWRVTYSVQEADIGKDAVAVLTDGYARIQSSPIRIVEPLSVKVPAAVAVGDTITPVFNWQLKASPAEGMTYQWQRDGVSIEGATSDTYITTENDLNHSLTLVISVTGTLYYTTDAVNVAAAINTYTVTWKNYDGTVLEIDEGVASGTTPTYDGETPTKASDLKYHYTFKGWSPDVTEVSGDVTYTAEYTASTRYYSVIWYKADGSISALYHNATYGAKILQLTELYGDSNPTKAADAQYTYTFDHWVNRETGELITRTSTITGNTKLDPVFTKETRKHTVTFDANGGTTEPASMDTGSDGTLEALPTPTRKDFVFDGWFTEKEGGDAVTTETKFTGDTTVYAHWTVIPSIYMAVTGAERTTVDAEAVTFTVSAKDMTGTTTATLTMALSETYLTAPSVQALNGWYVLAATYEGGVLTVIAGNNTGVTSAEYEDILTVTAKLTGVAGDATLTVTGAILSAYAGETEVYVNAVLDGACATTPVEYRIYDVNRDGVVNQLDLTRTQRWYGTSNPAYDLDKSGEVNVADLILILNNYTL